MHGDEPIRHTSATQEEEVTFIVDTLAGLKQLDIDSKDICLVVSGKKECEEYRQYIEHRGVKTFTLSKDNADDRTSDGVRIATMHRVKGLEFKAVFLIGKAKMPCSDDPAIQEEIKKKELALQYVAATRARQFLFICN